MAGSPPAEGVLTVKQTSNFNRADWWPFVGERRPIDVDRALSMVRSP